MKLGQAVLYTFLALLAVGCAAESAPAPAVDVAADEQAIRDISMQWLELDRAKNAAGITALMADDGTWFREGRDPLVGAAAQQAYMTQDWAENPTGQVTWATIASRSRHRATWPSNTARGASPVRGRTAREPTAANTRRSSAR